MKIGDRIFVRGYIDEIRKDTVIVRNDGGYFGTVPSEVITGELPSAQPEQHYDEWCTDCQEYDKERHCCPRWNKVIRQTLDEAQQPQWIPCSEPPEEDGVYIVYAPDYSGGSSSAKECHNGVMFSKYKNGKWSIEHGYYSRPNCVKAWKPIETWRGEEHETD